MKRDLDLMRKILLALEAHAHGFAPAPFTVPGYDDETIGHHVWLLQQAGLLTAAVVVALGDASPRAIPESLTWAGHEFLDTVRNDTVWRKLKALMKDQGLTLPLSVLQTLAQRLLEKMVGL